MENLFIIIFLSSLIFVVVLNFLSYARQYKRSVKRTRTYAPFINSLEEQNSNPDINTENWDLHKQRLSKFRRSQYKGLTFFVSSQNKVFYISEKGTKIYC